MGSPSRKPSNPIGMNSAAIDQMWRIYNMKYSKMRPYFAVVWKVLGRSGSKTPKLALRVPGELIKYRQARKKRNKAARASRRRNRR